MCIRDRLRTLSDGASATTYGRDPAIEVLIPKAYAPEPLLLPACLLYTSRCV